MKKLEIKKTKPTFIISVLKFEYYVVLVSSVSNFFTNKTSLANKWTSFSSSNLALVYQPFQYTSLYRDSPVSAVLISAVFDFTNRTK